MTDKDHRAKLIEGYKADWIKASIDIGIMGTPESIERHAEERALAKYHSDRRICGLPEDKEPYTFTKP